jgi:tetratricopeptide (TPR) repeat protein
MLAACSKPIQNLSAAELLDLGEKYLLELNYEQALVQFLKVIEIEPMNPRGYTGAAEAYIGLGDTESAEAVLRQGLETVGSENAGTLTDIWDRLASSPDPMQTSNDAEAIYHRFIQEHLIPEYGLASLERVEGVMQTIDDNWLSFPGITSAYISDLDMDGTEELFLLYMKKSEDGGWGVGTSMYSLYADVYTLVDGAPVKMDEVSIGIFSEWGSGAISLNSNHISACNLQISSVNTDNGKYIVIEYTSYTMAFANGGTDYYWVLKYDNGKMNIAFSIGGSGSGGIDYIGYTLENGEMMSSEVLYSDWDESNGTYNDFGTAVESFFGRFGIAAKYEERGAGILPDSVVDRRILSYTVESIDSYFGDWSQDDWYERHTFAFEAMDHTGLRLR